jgi:putative SOS response-associated peptidase YedK
MCGRFTLRAAASVIAEQFGPFEMPPFAARFNIAPTQPVAIVRPTAAGSGRELAWLRWGLVPAWAKDPAIGARLINARAETAAEKPAFRAAMRTRRCLVVADGFYEWQRTGRAKQAYLFQLRGGRPFAFAGLWETWRRPDNSPLETCTLLTTDANELVRPIHDRMPAILPPAAYQAWLDAAVENPSKLAPLFMPYPSGEMQAQAVGNFVNSPAHDSPRCIEAV